LPKRTRIIAIIDLAQPILQTIEQCDLDQELPIPGIMLLNHIALRGFIIRSENGPRDLFFK
jgi:hypothetical protein